MDNRAVSSSGHVGYPVQVHVAPSLERRNRITTAFRLILALPHLILVGGPIAATLSWTWGTDASGRFDWGAGGGAFGAAAAVIAMIAWFAILFTGRYPDGLWKLVALYLRWRVRAVAYVALLRDEYPPFSEAPYPAELELAPPDVDRDRLTVAFRLVLAVPHLLVIWALGAVWAVVSVITWFAILLTGCLPEMLYRFSVGVLRWSTRVEAYVLLLYDEYPPFSLN